MLPSWSATSPCGPESGVLRGNSLISPLFGSRRPSLLASCPVYQRELSGAIAGSWGRDLGVGTSNSFIDTLAVLAARLSAMAARTAEAAMIFQRLMVTSMDLEFKRKGWDVRNSKAALLITSG